MDDKLKNLCQEFLDNLAEAVFIADVENGRLLYANKAAEELTGYARNELEGMHFIQLHPKEEKQYYERKFREHVERGNIVDFEMEIITKKGMRKEVFVSARVIELEEKRYLVGIFHDIELLKVGDERKKFAGLRQLREILFRRALYLDSLTKIYNHRYLIEKLNQELQQAKKKKEKITSILIDLDNFQFINDVYGYREGDRVITNVSRILKDCTRKTDIVGRYADDAFLLILPHTDKKGGYQLATRIHSAITGLSIGSGEYEVSLSVSIAIVTYPDDGIYSVNEFLSRLEKLLNRAKEGGGNTIYVTGLDKVEDRIYMPQENMMKDFQNTLYGLSRRLHNTILETVFALANAVKAKDAYTKEHSEKIAHYAALTAQELNLSQDEVENIKIGAILHDIGKIGISDEVLNKPSSLTEEERKYVNLHPEIGANIIRTIKFLREVVPIILYHHERFDGKGNRWGLKGKEIPIGARIVSVIDVYHALISDRPYRKALSQEQAIKIIKEESGKKFDPEVVEAFLRILEKEKELEK